MLPGLFASVLLFSLSDHSCEKTTPTYQSVQLTENVQRQLHNISASHWNVQKGFFYEIKFSRLVIRINVLGFRANRNKRANKKRTKAEPTKAELFRRKLEEFPALKPRILFLGDSHVDRMSRVATPDLNRHGITFLGISGLNIVNWQRFIREVPLVDLILIQAWGNDFSQHPFKSQYTPLQAKTVKENLKSLVKVLLTRASLVLFTSPLPREGDNNIDELALQMRRQFGRHYLVFKTVLENDSSRGRVDTVHKSEETYIGLLNEVNLFLDSAFGRNSV